LHCAALWAKKAGIGDNIFRCPYCFFLLKVTSKSIKQLESQLTMDSKKEEGTEPTNSVKMVKVPEDKVEEIDDSCTYCSNIFTGEYKVFKCSNCGAYYHEMCLRKIYKELKACRNCGGTIT
jgi:DNA-directed RNA polymerase subunit RPC12/RpoP